jgi:hypothetical protein
LLVGSGFPAAEAKCSFSTKFKAFLVLSTLNLSVKLTARIIFGGQNEWRRT